MIEKKIKFEGEENCILVGLVHQEQTQVQMEEYLDELSFLAETAGAIEKKRFTQKLPHPDSRTFVGKGKLEEINIYIKMKGNISLVIFDDELSGSQIQNIEKVLNVTTIDRSDLILDIFARRAKTAQARAQVELAQYQYILPRLKGMWSHLERQGGGIGSRGPGETEIETDRRIVKDKIGVLKKKLGEYDKQAYTQRKDRGEFIRVALVGYTNVGKSTIMNLLSKSEVFAENKLFATLDTTTRKVVLEQTPMLLSDTVGFIRKLPHHLVQSFKSTLDEVREADLLLHVVDLSHPLHEDQMKVVQSTLVDIKAADKPIITIFNKLDKYKKEFYDEWLEANVKEELFNDLKQRWIKENKNVVFISAQEKDNIDELKKNILYQARDLYKIKYPYKTEFFLLMLKPKKYKIAESILDLFQDKEQPALKATKAGDKEICVIWLNNQLYACIAKCPHASGKMADGFIDALGNIVCPLHRYKFNPTNGLNTTGEGYFLKTFEIEENEDGLFVIY